ncbi:MAG: hypothetical protein H0Z39_09560 [Peptococcaceae bacterium]|nr:hypothetical protein [Peptococcaceae bacterium]
MILDLVKDQVQDELQRLDGLQEELEEALQFQGGYPTFKSRLCGDILEDFYQGLENIFRIGS